MSPTDFYYFRAPLLLWLFRNLDLWQPLYTSLWISRRKPPLKFFVMFVALSPGHCWQSWWMACPLSPLMEHNSLVSILVKYNVSILSCPLPAFSGYFVFSVRATQAFHFTASWPSIYAVFIQFMQASSGNEITWSPRNAPQSLHSCWSNLKVQPNLIKAHAGASSLCLHSLDLFLSLTFLSSCIMSKISPAGIMLY